MKHNTELSINNWHFSEIFYTKVIRNLWCEDSKICHAGKISKLKIQAVAASDSPNSWKFTASKSSDVILPFWSRSSGCVVSKPVRSWRFDIERDSFVLKPKVMIRSAWTRRKTNAAVKTIGKRRVSIGSPLSLSHRDIGWLSQDVNNTRCQNRSNSNQSEDGRWVVAHSKFFLWRNVTRSHAHPWMTEDRPANQGAIDRSDHRWEARSAGQSLSLGNAASIMGALREGSYF